MDQNLIENTEVRVAVGNHWIGRIGYFRFYAGEEYKLAALSTKPNGLTYFCVGANAIQIKLKK